MLEIYCGFYIILNGDVHLTEYCNNGSYEFRFVEYANNRVNTDLGNYSISIIISQIQLEVY